MLQAVHSVRQTLQVSPRGRVLGVGGGGEGAVRVSQNTGFDRGSGRSFSVMRRNVFVNGLKIDSCSVIDVGCGTFRCS